MPSNDGEPKIVKPEMIQPTYDWNRPLAAPGHSAVDFEERVNFRRLHDYRLARARGALARSDLGALLCFDNNNIRYISSTAIGEWSPPNITPYPPLSTRPQPHLWDFAPAPDPHPPPP